MCALICEPSTIDVDDDVVFDVDVDVDDDVVDAIVVVAFLPKIIIILTCNVVVCMSKCVVIVEKTTHNQTRRRKERERNSYTQTGKSSVRSFEAHYVGVCSKFREFVQRGATEENEEIEHYS